MSRLFLREGRWLLTRLIGVSGTRLVIAVCILLAASTAIGAARNIWFAVHGIAVDGVVVRQMEGLVADWRQAGTTGRSGPQMVSARRVYQAVVAYAHGGLTYEVTSIRRGPVHTYPLGSKQAVVFPPGRPGEGRIRAELPDFWTQAGLLLMGTIVGAATARWWWSMARRRPRFRRRPGSRRGLRPTHRPFLSHLPDEAATEEEGEAAPSRVNPDKIERM